MDGKVGNKFNFDGVVIDEDDNKEVVVFGIRKEGDEVVKVKRRMKGNNVDKAFKSIEADMERYTEI
ncbi:YycH family regulatory protein, partial [Staphylococcus epidermidis]|uniref:YycH family regulatory protein n=1 Tax=Staphylococcus epidermidis TaxID=1282 RepID=UPI0021B1B584